MMVLIGRNILSLFVSGEPEQIRQVLDIAYKYLFIMAVFLWILYLLHVYRSAIQRLGSVKRLVVKQIYDYQKCNKNHCKQPKIFVRRFPLSEIRLQMLPII